MYRCIVKLNRSAACRGLDSDFDGATMRYLRCGHPEMRQWAISASLILGSCNSWGKFWVLPNPPVPVFTNFAPANSTLYTVRSGFLIGNTTNSSEADALEYSFDSADYKTASGVASFKIPLPTGSSTWRLDSRHKISLRYRSAYNTYSSDVSYSVRKGNNRDINGDGYADLAVGADFYNSNQGRVYVFLSRGANGVASQNALNATAIISGEGGSQFGVSTALDDFNGDGYADLLVGANAYSAGIGRAYVIYSAGSAGIATQLATASGNSKIDGINGVNCNLGFSAYAGDVNGDGYADAVLGAYLDNSAGAGTSGGHVYILHSSGPAGIAVSSVTAASTNITAEAASSQFGASVALGDFNADGFADLVVGAPLNTTNTGKVYVFNSSGNGISSQTAPAASAVSGLATLISLGNSVATGDFNGDGYADFSTGAHGTSPSNTGAAFLFLSKPNFTAGPAVTTATSANFSIGGQAANDAFGFSVAFGDTNGDGMQDWLVHAQLVSGLSKAHVFHSANGAPSSLNASTPNTLITGENSGDFLGAFSGTYDINADGYDDLILGAYTYSSNAGRVYIYLSPGKNGITSGSATNAITIITGEPASKFGHSMPF